MTREH
jgi:hypothetical protein